MGTSVNPFIEKHRKQQREPLPDTPEGMLKLLSSLSDEEIDEMVSAQKELEQRLAEFGPQTDDELHDWIKSEFGFDIPRVAVCEGHQAPFEFLSDLFFERVDAALAMANRGGAKTFIVAILHWLNSLFKPGCESCTFGATEAQSLRCVAADTLIDCPRDMRRFPNGIPISQIKPGKLVWTFNEILEKFELKPVVKAWSNGRKKIFCLTLDDGSVIRATKDHKFLRRNGNWAELQDLVPGDSLMPFYRDFEPLVRLRPNEASYKVVSIEPERVETVWDMEVEDNHNFVSNGIVLHNCYAHLKNWIYDKKGEKREIVVSSLMRETVFANGSEVFILPGTPQAVNGPHPQKAHADEIELMDDGTWAESRSMTVGKRLADGRFIKPQDIGTSTRKGPRGRMQKLIDEITDAINHGYKPPRKLYQWCIKETAAQVKNCQVALPGLPEDRKCQCHLIRKGEWSEKDEEGRPRPRLLRDICQGDFYKSRGWQPYGDVVKQFTENDPETFEVQQLCLKPEMKNHYLPKFSEERYCIRNYDANPLWGPIFTSTDWGGTNPHAVNWYQYLQVEVEVDAWIQANPNMPNRIRLKEGTIVCFDEIYKAEIGNTRLGQLVKFKEAGYRRKWGEAWEVKERFADPAGKSARKDWKDMGLKTSWHITREFEEHIKVSNDLFDADLFVVDGEKAPMWVREAKEWRRHPVTGQQIDTFNHCMSEYRYAIANIRKLFPVQTLTSHSEVPFFEPAMRESVVQITIRKPDQGPLGFESPSEDEFSRWRQGLGQPIKNPW